MAGFFSKTLDVLKRLAGGGAKPPKTPPAPPPVSPPGGREPTEDVHYLKGHDKILPRWSVDTGNDEPLTLEEARRLLSHIPRRQTYTIVIHGISEFNISEYFEQEEAWISYVVPRSELIKGLYDPSVDTATGAVNDFIHAAQPITGYGTLDYWWMEVYGIQIIDKG